MPHLGGAWKHIPRKIPCFEDTEVTRFMSCFLGVFSQGLRIPFTWLYSWAMSRHWPCYFGAFGRVGFFFVFFNDCFMCIDVLPTCVSEQHLHAWCPEARKGHRIPLELGLSTAVSSQVGAKHRTLFLWKSASKHGAILPVPLPRF